MNDAVKQNVSPGSGYFKLQVLCNYAKFYQIMTWFNLTTDIQNIAVLLQYFIECVCVSIIPEFLWNIKHVGFLSYVTENQNVGLFVSERDNVWIQKVTHSFTQPLCPDWLSVTLLNCIMSQLCLKPLARILPRKSNWRCSCVKSRINLNLILLLHKVSVRYLDAKLGLRWKNAGTNHFYWVLTLSLTFSSVTITVGQIRFTGTSEERKRST